MIIRQIRADEGEQFRAVRLQAIADSPSAFGSTLAETQARPPAYWAHRAARGAAGEETVLFVAEEAGGWVGVVGGFLEEEGGARSVDLVSMWVNPAYRRQGLARQLVERLIAWAHDRGAERVALWVTETNAAA
ncbi:MAG: GNAT family N-acetyltransferase, partial [Chloroflexi bacterium]|nr:GNAT family N-acetyltransferase [Chloroflexota bacterium]